MKKGLLILFLAILAGNFLSCKDKCNETRIVEKQVPITYPLSDMRNNLKTIAAREIHAAGKMAVKGQYLFINEIGEGIHVIDNSDPANPRFLSFLQIPGNGDIVIFNNTLYADSYCDMVALAISDVNNIKETDRLKQIFRSGWFNEDKWSILNDSLFKQEYKTEYVTETIDCENPNMVDPEPVNSLRESTISGNFPKVFSRLNLNENDLFTIEPLSGLRRYSLSNPSSPVFISALTIPQMESPLFWTFANQKVLYAPFFARTILFDLSNPSSIPQISVLENRAPCDKFIFEGQIAYVISQGGGFCGNPVSKLDLLDISDASAPTIISTYPMKSPQNLAIDFPFLYVCEGVNGFKVFDVTDKMNVDKNLITSNTELHANDIILSGKVVIVNAEDGIYQFDATDPKNLKQLSKISF
ncbi:LVIVD repeat-containing protein [Dyadobacter subterraneus]|uniref:LVIVD repeat-containing protein n=1 Tax=Dyadobacter subterraneus TaxID=2773304 RepID=A0ABR9WLL6_9BACT|nr:hypothetical protein [Dyadobacter subterraneus]MBE9465781.1 hypothetical protein [Dyadobacter subterraneus]